MSDEEANEIIHDALPKAYGMRMINSSNDLLCIEKSNDVEYYWTTNELINTETLSKDFYPLMEFAQKHWEGGLFQVDIWEGKLKAHIAAAAANITTR